MKQYREKPACSEKSAPYPIEVKCPNCNASFEIWSDEVDVYCVGCGRSIDMEKNRDQKKNGG